MTTPQGMLDKGACETPMRDHVKRFWKYLETETVRILVDMRRDTSSVPYWDSSSFSDAVAKALVADRRQAAAPQGREALELADDLISELANKFYSIDPYTRAGTTEGARHDLAAIDKVKAKIRAALTPAVAPDGAGEAQEILDAFLTHVPEGDSASADDDSSFGIEWHFNDGSLFWIDIDPKSGPRYLWRKGRDGKAKSGPLTQAQEPGEDIDAADIWDNYCAEVPDAEQRSPQGAMAFAVDYLATPPPQVDSGREAREKEITRLATIEECVNAARDGFEAAMKDYVLIGPSGMAMQMINSIKALGSGGRG